MVTGRPVTWSHPPYSGLGLSPLSWSHGICPPSSRPALSPPLSLSGATCTGCHRFQQDGMEVLAGGTPHPSPAESAPTAPAPEVASLATAEADSYLGPAPPARAGRLWLICEGAPLRPSRAWPDPRAARQTPPGSSSQPLQQPADAHLDLAAGTWANGWPLASHLLGLCMEGEPPQPRPSTSGPALALAECLPASALCLQALQSVPTPLSPPAP